MQKADIEFFDEYKHLDRLCGDMYSCSNGVTEYITQMEKNADIGRGLVANGDSDYKMLKHLRWVRNQIAHDTENCRISEISDRQDVENFYDRIFDGEDPLTKLRKAKEEQQRRIAARKKKVPASVESTEAMDTGSKDKSGWKRFWFLRLFIVAVIIIVLLIK